MTNLYYLYNRNFIHFSSSFFFFLRWHSAVVATWLGIPVEDWKIFASMIASKIQHGTFLDPTDLTASHNLCRFFPPDIQPANTVYSDLLEGCSVVLRDSPPFHHNYYQPGHLTLDMINGFMDSWGYLTIWMEICHVSQVSNSLGMHFFFVITC